MFNLSKKVEKNNIYLGAGNTFSKLLMSKTLLEKENFIIVCDNEKTKLNYLNIASFLFIDLYKADNIYDFVNLFYNGQGKTIIDKDVLHIFLDQIEQFEYHNIFNISKNDHIKISTLNKKLLDLGYKFSDYEEKNSFKIVGDTLIFIDNFEKKLTISFWDEVIDSIFYDEENFDTFYLGRNKKLKDFDYKKDYCSTFSDLLSGFSGIIYLDNIDYYSEYDFIFNLSNNYLVFSSLGNSDKSKELGYNDLLIKNIDELTLLLENKKIKKYIITKNKKTINNYINLNNLDDVVLFDTKLNHLKSLQSEEELIICDDNISRVFIKKRIKRSISENLDLLLQIKQSDYVVHIDHGVGIFREIVEKELGGIKKEYITIEYKNEDKLFVPITEISRVSKYVGSENPKLTGLSTKEWEKKLSKVSEDVEKIASELLEIFAKRKLQIGHSFPSKPEEESKFFNSFEYEYTPDQYNVIREIYDDMESENPMDRLLSGDVGFGKTEVAFAAIFKSIINGKQAALISPLIVLAYEHFEKAKERFFDFPFNVEVITRFEKASVIKTVLEKLKTGKIDLIIGTHRLLSQDVQFKNLGLLVIDEEHKFGVKDKEKIKQFKGNIDILSMSATPIPRSLNMALNGLKQVSMLTTAPVGKQSIQTIVSSFDDDVIFDACKREFERGGQVFFIHNRVETISGVQSYLEKLLPGKKVVVAHGQLPGDSLEKRILEFKRKEYDILLATTVVENGIDFRDVNTIFISNSNNFGISQIHQLRGRVGRGLNKGYCYLLFNKDKIKEDAAKRLKTIVDYSHLGAGFELAIKDLEIRGGGDILGIKQSGTSIDVGVSLFLEMLEDKIEKMKKEQNLLQEDDKEIKRINTSIDLDIESYIPDDFFSSELDKINFYREIESIRSLEDLSSLISDFNEINEKIPKSVNNLFDLIKLKIISFKYNILKIKKIGINYQIDFSDDSTLEDIRRFLDLDKNLNFVVITPKRLRSSIKNFESEENFIQYLLLIFENKIKPKIKIKRKNRF